MPPTVQNPTTLKALNESPSEKEGKSRHTDPYAAPMMPPQ